jgi:hypothetical protein
MRYSGKHVAPRPKGRASRFARAVPLAMAMVLVMGTVASADHTVSLAFDPGSPVVSGTEVDVKFNTDRREGNAALYQCRIRDSDTGVIGTTPMGVDVCGMPSDLNNAPAAEATGAWVFIKNADRDTATPSNPVETTHKFDTTGFVGTAGWAVQHPPLNHEATSNALTFADLVVNPAGGDGHPGCSGIEKAYEQVTSNNGAAKGNGKAAAALEQVALKLGCDLGA